MKKLKQLDLFQTLFAETDATPSEQEKVEATSTSPSSNAQQEVNHEVAITEKVDVVAEYEDKQTKVPQPVSLAQTKTKRGRKSTKETYNDLSLMQIPSDEELQKKLYHSIRVVAKWFHLPASQIRYWENEFDVLKPRKNKKGDRYFKFEDIQHLKTIYHLIRIQKFSIEGAKAFLKAKQHAKSKTEVIETLQKMKLFLNELKALYK